MQIFLAIQVHPAHELTPDSALELAKELFAISMSTEDPEINEVYFFVVLGSI